MLTNKFRKVPISSITIPPNRQRRTVDVSDLLPSIQRRGVLVPICITESGTLVMGERRLTAAKQLGLTEIPARIAPDNLSQLDLKILELEENLLRQDLPWQEKALAMAELHAIHGGSLRDFAEYTGYSHPQISKFLDAAKEIAAGNERVAQAPALHKAINVIRRQSERETNNAISDLLDTIAGTSEAPPTEAPREDILNTSFHDWARTYSGPKFNLLHCDFPYGVGLDDSDQLQAGGTAHKTYTDDAGTFWALLETLARQQDRIVSHSAHMIFWHSMKEDLYLPMRQFFRERLPEWTFDDYPLVWLKSDNRGIAPDVERRPRRIYETALFGWRGDRKLVKLGNNAYAAPKENGAHPSTKPEPMLRYFFTSLVDHNSRVLDPTCGSGSALRAAESLGAGSILGLELDSDFHADAVARLRKFRASARLAETVA